MNLSVGALRTDRQWRSATGLDQKRFAKLLVWVERSYEQIYGKTIQQRQADCPDQPALKTYTDLLLFTLFSFQGFPMTFRALLLVWMDQQPNETRTLDRPYSSTP